MLTPACSWWRPRTIVRSSATWYEMVSYLVFVSVPPGVMNAPLTVRAIAPGTYVYTLMPASLVRSEEHTSELQSLMRITYAVFCLKKKKHHNTHLRHL